MLQEAGHIKSTVVLIFPHIQCLHFMNPEILVLVSQDSWVLVSSETQVRLQRILNPDNLPDYFSISYDYGHNLQTFGILL